MDAHRPPAPLSYLEPSPKISAVGDRDAGGSCNGPPALDGGRRGQSDAPLLGRAGVVQQTGCQSVPVLSGHRADHEMRKSLRSRDAAHTERARNVTPSSLQIT
jgi:hypothetical protein